MENDEKKYEDVIKTLKGLQEVKAPVNFEANLQRKINSEKFQNEEKKSFWENIFIPTRLIPSLGLIATAILIIFVVETNSEEIDNPFLIQPRLREDLGKVSDYRSLGNSENEEVKEKTVVKDVPVIEERKKENELKASDDKMMRSDESSGKMEGMSVEKNYALDQNAAESFETVVDSASVVSNIVEVNAPTAIVKIKIDSTAGQISKDELNFRQIQLTEEQQKVVNELKDQVQSLNKSNKEQK
ncbi:MAG: hypothetical protein DAHOPDDO_02280 [Ignavibacteriaceae bacterium]|nr:hypothetical protein [Ignavibacteriaceae bacterium]